MTKITLPKPSKRSVYVPPHTTSGASVRDGFTLIELLTVIAIIGILAAIIVPTVGAVRKTARAAACVSNLRQIGVAMRLHAEEYKGLLPAAKPSEEWPKNMWQYYLNPYLENRKGGDTDANKRLVALGVFLCPGKPDFDLASANPYSYTMNSFGSNTVGRALSAFDKPSITALVMDSGSGDPSVRFSTTLYQDSPALWHKGKDNVLFVDGHVEAVAKNGLNYYLVKTTDPEVQP
ncbi:hypothetical protein OPIT5_10235 [Opitutaceae bacterium TAV5]|nr:hypothetical protein OPIT5_10235 [Opitutaceae bacterium TAV5]